MIHVISISPRGRLLSLPLNRLDIPSAFSALEGSEVGVSRNIRGIGRFGFPNLTFPEYGKPRSVGNHTTVPAVTDRYSYAETAYSQPQPGVSPTNSTHRRSKYSGDWRRPRAQKLCCPRRIGRSRVWDQATRVRKQKTPLNPRTLPSIPKMLHGDGSDT